MRGRRTLGGLIQGILNDTLRLCVQSAGGFIEEKDSRVGDDSTSDGDTLLLTTRYQKTALSDQSVISVRQFRHESVGVGFDACLLDQGEFLVLWSILPLSANQTVGDVILDSGGEKDGFLRNETNLATKPLDVKLFEIDAIQSNDTRQRIVEPFDQVDDGRLPRSRSANQGDVGSSIDRE